MHYIVSHASPRVWNVCWRVVTMFHGCTIAQRVLLYLPECRHDAHFHFCAFGERLKSVLMAAIHPHRSHTMQISYFHHL